jgi:hypothetical protein
MWSTTAADALRERENDADALDKGWLAEKFGPKAKAVTYEHQPHSCTLTFSVEDFDGFLA